MSELKILSLPSKVWCELVLFDVAVLAFSLLVGTSCYTADEAESTTDEVRMSIGTEPATDESIGVQMTDD